MCQNSVQIIGFAGKGAERRQVCGYATAFIVLSVGTKRSCMQAQTE